MINKIGRVKLFAQIFNFGLLLLFAGLFREYFFAPAQTDDFQFGTASFFAAGVCICLISLILLFVEWMILPFGTQVKRRALYQGAGNLFGLALLGGAYLLIAEQSLLNLACILPFSLGSGGILVAATFAFWGKPIVGELCRKKIKSKILTGRNLPKHTDSTINLNDNNRNVRPQKIQKFLSEAQ